MARKKLKYRDVVRGHGKSKNGNKKKQKKPQRKTYSLYKKDLKTSKTFKEKKRYEHPIQEEEPNEPQTQEDQVETESEDEDIENDYEKLKSTLLGSKNTKSLAIESDEDTESEIEDANEKMDTQEESGNEIDSNSDSDAAGNIDEDNEDPEMQKEEDNINKSQDLFIKHFHYDLHENLLNALQNSPVQLDSFMENWPKLRKIQFQIPHAEEVEDTQSFSLEGNKMFAPSGRLPHKINRKTSKPEDLYIKSQIIGNLIKSNKILNGDNTVFFTELQNEIFAIINNYQDFYFSERTFSNAEELRYIYSLHAINHIIKTRNRVLHHNAKLLKKNDVPEEFRDQGLVRPKVLIVVPFKHSAYQIVTNIIDILFDEDKGNVMNRKRFIDEFTGNELCLPKKNPKPEDYELIFSGNTSDDFRLGLSLTKKTLKLYSNFYSSDIIIASPLGLRTVIGAEGEAERDYDFLASIEILIFDQTELFLMQNWDHVLHILNHTHLQPKESHGTDFSRVRTWTLNGWSRYYRQTLIFSSMVLPEINAIFNKKCSNFAGKCRTVNPIEFGAIGKVINQLPHVFHKFEAPNAVQAIDARFEFFLKKILPPQRDRLMRQTLIFVSNYFDFVRLRNYFKKEDIGFVQICEYSKENKVARARDIFFHGDAHFLVYTERFHFFNRIKLKGIRHLIFYQPPNFPNFYYEMCNLMQEGNMNRKIGNNSNMTVNVIYSKYDSHQLGGIVGTERMIKMLQSDRNVHMIVTGSD